MLTKDLRFEGFTTEDWSRLLSLWKSTRPEGDRAGAPSAAEVPRGGLLVIHSGGKVRKLYHTTSGRIDPAAMTWPAPLADLAARYRARWVLASEAATLPK